METMKPLENAILRNDYEEVKRLLEFDPPIIDEVDRNGRCMALVAAMAGDFDILKYVVEYSRASMNIYDKEHKNILHYGVMSGNMEIVRYLVERVGMNPLEGDINLVTPFDLARQYCSKVTDDSCEGKDYHKIEEYFAKVCGADFDEMYRNPIRTGMFPDPSIVRVGEDYYMVNSSFIFFPCIPVSHSKDLIHWEIIGYAITNPEWAALDELEGGRGFWAPDISYHDGKFFIAATYRLNDTGTVYRKQFVVSSEKPEGPYSKPAIIDEDGIDPSIFVDDDGRKYMLLNRGARIFELNRECTEQISDAQLLYYGDNKRAPEGPHLLKKDGYYYLFEAEGGTGPGHRITVSRSRTLKGIYEPCPYNPIMRQTDENAAIQRCGHGKPVMTQNGQWYMVYLCGRMVDGKYSILGRETALDEITWTADGWPIVNHLNGPGTLNKKPNLTEMKFEDDELDGLVKDDFQSDRLRLYWMHPRAPKDGEICIKNGQLVIRGSRYDMDSTKCRSIVLQRQRDFSFVCKTKMHAEKLKSGQNAGMTCYYDENTFLKFGLFCEEGKVFLKVVEHIDEETRCSFRKDITKEPDASTDSVFLMIETEFLKREFLYSLDGVNYHSIGVLDNVYYLCDEGIKRGKRFTGAMTGLYAYSGSEETLTAYFDFFEYSKEGKNIETR
ncbi:MAG: family 43 glycosylhydrolase [Thermoflexaceae bacterium]|nr:family 43 glycosylhydrolase [Thermoflexaceae bacterium]